MSGSLAARGVHHPGRPRLRLHQRLPRRGQLDRHRRLHARAHARCRRWSGRPSSTSSPRSASASRSPRPSARASSTPGVVDQWVILGGLIGAIVWNLITWYFGLPSSSSHALIGGFAGAAVAKAGFGALVPTGLAQDRSSSSCSRPSSAWRSGFVLMVATLWIFRARPPEPRGQRCSAGCSSSRRPPTAWATAPTTRRRRWASSPSCSSRAATSGPSSTSRSG